LNLLLTRNPNSRVSLRKDGMRTLLDKLGRPLRDLRISVTDRCNFRCTYCMPKEIFGKDFPYLEKAHIMTFEEIDRLVGIFTRLGVKKVRLTGGEPLLRKNLSELVSMLSIRDLEIALTTNGVLLPRYAPALSAAGLDRVTVSLDAIDEGTFASITDSGHTVAAVLAGIEAAESVGLGPIKINTVVKRNVNENEILDLVSRFSSRDIAVRFIEYMDVGSTNGWKMDDVVPAREILQIVGPVKSIEPSSPSDVAKMYQMEGGGQVGVISSVTEPFCGNCSRARISADGRLYPCLFSNSGLDLLSPLRQGAEDEFLEEEISRFWTSRTDRYSEVRTDSNNNGNKIEMSYIGG
jgi:cyclic pyranopterin phosphate synthase